MFIAGGLYPPSYSVYASCIYARFFSSPRPLFRLLTSFLDVLFLFCLLLGMLSPPLRLLSRHHMPAISPLIFPALYAAFVHLCLSSIVPPERRSFPLTSVLCAHFRSARNSTSPWRIVSSAVPFRYTAIPLFRFPCRARGVGGLPLRCPFSTTGHVRPRVRRFLLHPPSLADRKRRPARSVSMRV